jgi:Peptidase family M23
MSRRETNSQERLPFKEPVVDFGRWLCGHRTSEEYLSLHSRFQANQNFSLLNISRSVQVSDAFDFNKSSSWDQTLDSIHNSQNPQHWPGLSQNMSEVIVEGDSDFLNLRSAFFKHGSNFLRYKSAKQGVKPSCSRTALYLAGSVLDPGAGLIKPQLVQDVSAFFSNAVSSLRLSQPNPIAVCHSLLIQLSSPPRLIDPEELTAESQFALLPWDSLVLPWLTPVQFTTAIAVAIPMLVSATGHKPLLPSQSEPRHREGPATATTITQRPGPSATGYLKTQLRTHPRYLKPTGRIANIQSYIYPAKGELTSGYGWRWGRMHRGIDIAGPIGTPIVAAASGKVITAGWDSTGFGNRIEIQHPDGTVTLYGHSSQILTHVGAHVHQGQAIAEMGNTGHSTGSHLHFQMYRSNQKIVNPMDFLVGKKLSQPPA